MRTLLLFITLCITLGLGFYAQTSEVQSETPKENTAQTTSPAGLKMSSPAGIESNYPFRWIKDHQKDEYHLVYGVGGFHSFQMNVVKVETISKTNSRGLASIDPDLGYKISILKEDVKTVSRSDFNQNELQLQIIAP